MPEQIFPRRSRRNTPGEDKTLVLGAIARKYALSEPTENQDSALRLLCMDIHRACEYLEDGNENNPFLDDGLGRCYRLAIECWNVSADQELPKLGDGQLRVKILAWLTKWRERFFGWRDHPELETLPRMTEITRLLQIWLVIDLHDHTNERRGCPDWLQEKGFWREGQKTRFDSKLKRHVILVQD